MSPIYSAILALVTAAGPTPAPTLPAVTVRQVVTMQALAWQTVTVSGRCLAAGSPAIARGSRPFSGQVWQLEDNGVATWVVGKMPRDCGESGATITARVVQDTLPLFGPARSLRQYLVVR